jgi:hypothetical protein
MTSTPSGRSPKRAVRRTDGKDIQGLGFDYRQRLWAWTGDFLVPLQCEYDAYLYDEASRTLYMTDPCEKVRLS